MNVTEPISVFARETPDAPAILTAGGTLTYAELDRAVSWTAETFRKAGLKSGDIAGIDVSRQTRHLVSSLALARLGVGELPFYQADPPLLRQELAAKAGLAAIVSDRSSGSLADIPLIEPPPAGIDDLKDLPPVEIAAASDGALPFWLVRTSGTTTGIPNVGVLGHAAAQQRFRCFSSELPEGRDNRYLGLANLAFLGAKFNVVRCLITGGCVALAASSSTPREIADFVAEHRINNLACVPLHAAALLDIARDGEMLLPGLEALLLSSTLISETSRLEVQRRLTPNLFVGYGIVEVGYIAIAPSELVRTIPGAVGRLSPGIQGDIVDEDDNPLPPGETGKLRLKSPGMVEGYLGAANDAARAFRDGWFYSSDLVEFTSDGVLIHHGRADDAMIFDGMNIMPAEIENILLRHPAVAEAAAFPLRSRDRGDVPAAAVVIRSQVSVDDLKSHCRSWLGVRAPHGLAIVPSLQRNAAGKILKHELPGLFQVRE